MNKNNEDSRFELDISEIIKRALKYLLEGAAVALAARYIPSEKIELNEVAGIAFTAACVFAILDMYAPSVSVAARTGAGFAIGSSAVGGIK
tara:strand:+ start:1001 stop:1273 length:273 start_codon:yes stop_codon:yes gene_type:complete